MPNNYFRFKQFKVNQEQATFKVGTDGVLMGACADLPDAKNILDIGTGTGLIALMAAQRSKADIVAIEPDEDSFSQAAENVKDSPWSDRIVLVNKDFQRFWTDCTNKFDIIITNPPYFKDSLKNPDGAKSSARHSDALSSEDILSGSRKLLNDKGSLQLILPYIEGTLFIAEAIDYGFFCNRIIKVRPSPAGEIIRLILKFERTKKKLSEKFLTIETGTRHSYTEEYKEVTKDFYL
jgi:tRNA1Val (adenine37-N6)-methyltransferase